MKKLLITSLLAAQMLAGTPAAAAAAEFTSGSERQAGAFAGFRLRVPLDGSASQRQLRAGFTVAPAVRTRNLQGQSRTQIGEGLELGVRGGEPVSLSVAGTPVAHLTSGGNAPEGQKAGVSTLGWVAIGVGAVVVVGLTAGYLWLDDALDCDPEDECN